MVNFLLIASIFLGIGVGFLLRSKKKLIALNERMTMVLIYAFLALLGISVGRNETVLKNIASFGWDAFLIAVAAIAGSIVVLGIVDFKFFRNKNNTHAKTQ